MMKKQYEYRRPAEEINEILNQNIKLIEEVVESKINSIHYIENRDSKFLDNAVLIDTPEANYNPSLQVLADFVKDWVLEIGFEIESKKIKDLGTNVYYSSCDTNSDNYNRIYQCNDPIEQIAIIRVAAMIKLDKDKNCLK